jgi:hypothetical protein
MPVYRPQGVKCNNFVYPDKQNTFQKLKEFLFDGTNGRTDVVFFASKATGKQMNSEYPDTFQDDDTEGAFVGGLIDGFAKAIIQGNTAVNRNPRPLYGTSVFFGYHSNRSAGFDRWDSTTWENANPKGHGGFLAGSSSYYDSWYYYKNSTGPVTANSFSFGYYPFSFSSGGPTYPQWDEDFQQTTDLFISQLWPSAFWDGVTVAVGGSQPELKRTFSMFNSLESFHVNVQVNQKLSALNPSLSYEGTFTTTPEQPQRYWEDENPWMVRANIKLPIGIGLVENGVVSSLSPLAVTHGYIPSGLTVGQTETQVESNPNAILTNARWDLTARDWRLTAQQQTQYGIGPSELGNWGEFINQASEEQRNWISNFYTNKKLIIRWLTIQELITKFGLNVSSAPSTLTNEAAWKSKDGVTITDPNGNVVIFRSMWANCETIMPATLNEYITKVTNEYHNVWGIATGNVSDFQLGKPLLFYWGRRLLELTTGVNNIYELSKLRYFPQDSYPSVTQINGFPVLLSAVLPSGFFAVSSQDTTALNSVTGFNKYRSRGIVSKRNGGSFYGGTSLTLTNLGPSQQAALLPFRSNNFKYVVNTYHFDKRYSDVTDPTTNPSFTATIQGSTSMDGPWTVRAQQAFTLGPASTVPSFNARKQAVRTINTLTYNASANNTDDYFRFSFLGDGLTGNNTLAKGDMLITTHYGVDVNNTNGISFSVLNLESHYRSGDAAYQNISGRRNREAYWLEFFKAIHDRQTLSTLGGNSTKPKKLVFMVEIGVWELANPNFTYNGFNTWTYLINALNTNTPNGSTGTVSADVGFKTVEYVLNAALMCGFKREDIVICYYTPTLLPTVRTHSQGTLNGLTINTKANELALITDPAKVSTSVFTRATEIFENTFLRFNGFFNPSTESNYGTNVPVPPLNLPAAAKNVVYLNMGSMVNVPDIKAQISGNYVGYGVVIDTAGPTVLGPNFSVYSGNGATTLGSFLMDYIVQENAPVYFVPPWIPSFSAILNYTTEPVDDIPLNLVSVSLDPVDIEPYLALLDTRCDQGNVQAKRTLSKFKTKILQ